MVYDYTFHMYIAKQEGIIQYKERCISSLTTISALLNSVQVRAVVRVGDCTCLKSVMLSLQDAAAFLNVLFHSLSQQLHMLQQYSAYRDCTS